VLLLALLLPPEQVPQKRLEVGGHLGVAEGVRPQLMDARLEPVDVFAPKVQVAADKVADVDKHTAQLLVALGDALGRLFALEKDAHHILEHLQRALCAQVRVDLALALFVERLVHGSMCGEMR